MKFVYGSSERIFVNTSIGCNSSCQYCYLPKINGKQSVLNISEEEAIWQVKQLTEFKEGEEGTIISIGCYSECLDEINREKTRRILEAFLPRKNYIQLATKQRIEPELINSILMKRCFKQQISIYVSMPTISRISEIEKGTVSLEGRVNNIKTCVENGIQVVLYIKPFLGKVTSQDKALYVELIKKYNIPVVIGPYLTTDNLEVMSDVGETALYERKMGKEYDDFIEEIEKVTKVVRHSTELIKLYRQGRKKDGKAD